MKTSTVLYESLPMVRIGIPLDNEAVSFSERPIVSTADFSTTAFMLEEFISLGHTEIAIRSSSPEAKIIEKMPKLLRKHVRVIDDSHETEVCARLLYPIRAEIGVGMNPDGVLIFPKDMPSFERDEINRMHGELLRLAIGFNYQVQVAVDPIVSIKIFRNFRQKIKSGEARTILALLEGVLRCYQHVEFESPCPRGSAPQDIVVTFDRIVNDPTYLEMSNSINTLAQPKMREAALLKIRELGRKLLTNLAISRSWDYIGKIVNVWTGVPLPDAIAISALTSNKELPLLLDLEGARERAVRMWMASAPSDPLRAIDPRNYTPDPVHWLPPMASARSGHPDSLSLIVGTVEELQDEIIAAEKDSVGGKSQATSQTPAPSEA